MTSKSRMILARYLKYLQDVFSDLDEMDQKCFWEFVGAPDDRFTNLDSIPPTWQEKLGAFHSKLSFLKNINHFIDTFYDIVPR